MRPGFNPNPIPRRPVLTDAVPRFRSKNAIVFTDVGYQQQWPNCAGPSTWTDVSALGRPPAMLNGRDERMQDWVVPRYHQRSKNGEVFFNNMFREVVTVESKAGGTWSQKAKNPYVCSGVNRFHEYRHTGPAVLCFIPTTTAPRFAAWPEEPSVMSSDSIEKLKRLVSTEVLSRRGRSDSDLWETIAELDKTLHLLRGPVAQLSDLARRLNRSIVLDARSRFLVKEISADYLLYRYGISPLMKDIQSIMKTFERTLGKQRKTYRAQDSDYSKSLASGSLLLGSAKVDWSRETIETISVRGVALEEVDLSFISNIGFSTKGLITLPWELMSYSFVADWFFNLGSYIGAMVPAYGYKNLGSCLSIEHTRSTLYRFNGYQSPTEASWTFTGLTNGTCAVVRQTSTRQGLATPSLEMKSDFKFDNMTRMADAVSLIAQRFVNIQKVLGPVPVRHPTYSQRKNFSLWLNQPGVS